MDSMTLTAFVREVREASRDQIAARRVGGAICLHTGQTYIDGDEVTVYIGHGRDGSLSMTDLGETMQRVSIFLVPQDAFSAIAKQIAAQFGFQLKDGELGCLCMPGEAGERALGLARCAATLEAALTAAAIVSIETSPIPCARIMTAPS